MSSSEDISLERLFLTLKSYWRWISLFTLFCLGAAVMAAYLWTPVYRAEALLAFNDEQSAGGLSALTSQFGGLASMAGLNLGNDKSEKDIALALVTARSFLGRFIAEEDLLPVLFASRWDDKTKSWKSRPPSLAEGIERMRKSILTVTEDRRTGLIRVAVELTKREMAAEWANELVSRVNAVTRNLTISEARARQNYLRGELNKSEVVELRQSIYRLIESELKKEMLANVRVQYSFRVLDAASVPEARDFVRPRRLLMAVFGLIFGLAAGIFTALMHNALRANRVVADPGRG